MALPTEGPLSMLMIANEFEQGDRNLSLRFFGSALLVPGVEGNIQLAANFYGKGSTGDLKEFLYNPEVTGDGREACLFRFPSDIAYYNGKEKGPQIGDAVFADKAGKKRLEDGFYKFAINERASFYMLVIEGLVQELGICER